MFYVLNIFIIKEITLHYLVFWEKTISLMYTAAVHPNFLEPVFLFF
jgi:hypothetical protein